MMARNDSFDNITVNLQKQLALARAEISNLRKEIKSLKYSQIKDIENVKSVLETWRCPTCQNISNGVERSLAQRINACQSLPNDQALIKLQPIGVINTGFVRKRAVPRQPTLNLSSHGKITLHNNVFTNPEHSVEGLEGFSHMWILFHFHKNESSHIRAKVAPPRLNGARVGVFGTRSPHRPSPIGLSLVQIEKIEGSSIYFSGVDMLDGTPVLDLKPYIPHYDNPVELSLEDPDTASEDMERLELDGQEAEPQVAGAVAVVAPVMRLGTLISVSRPQGPGPSEREAPDGEEGQTEDASPHMTHFRGHSPLPSSRHVRVPEWISRAPVPQLQVLFTPQAQSLLSSLESPEDLTRVITDILCEDPRSVYLRDRYSNQFFTFLINNFHVSCKFDDVNRSVKVFRIVSAGSICECGRPEWQCSIHGPLGNN